MSFNRIAIQSLQAARERASRNPLLSTSDVRGIQNAQTRAIRNPLFTGMSGLGVEFDEATYNARPTIDYVKAGDVIRVYVAIDAGLYFGGGDIGAKFQQELAKAFNVVRAPSDASGFFGSRAWVVDVQPRSDYNRLQDITSVVLHAAQAAGLNANPGVSYGQFVSKVETTGTTPPTTLPTPGAPASNTGSGDGLANFFSGLTQSPVTLAVILGAAVILVIAAKK